MKAGIFLGVSVGAAAIAAGVGLVLVSLAAVRALDSIAQHYEEQTKIARDAHASSQDTGTLVVETLGFACAKVLAKFQLINPEDEKQIVSSAASRIEHRSATVRALVDAVERRSASGSPPGER